MLANDNLNHGPCYHVLTGKQKGKKESFPRKMIMHKILHVG